MVHGTGSAGGAKVVVRPRGRLNRSHVERPSLLEEVMSEPRLFRGGEDRSIVDHAATELRPVHRAELRTRRLALAHKVLDVNHRKAVRVLAEIVDRIAPRENHPATVDLELNQPRIGFPQQQVVADACAVLGDEFEVVIVIAVLKSGARGLLADAVGELGGALCLVKAHADRKSTRLNSSHSQISYAVFCLKKKQKAKSDYPTRHFIVL